MVLQKFKRYQLLCAESSDIAASSGVPVGDRFLSRSAGSSADGLSSPTDTQPWPGQSRYSWTGAQNPLPN